MPPGLLVFLVSAVPIAEMKVGIPMGIARGLDPVPAVILGILGTLAQLPFNLLFLRVLVNLAQRMPLARRFYVWSRFRSRKHRSLVRRFGILGVALIVAVPLPGTGLFTGTLAGSLIGLGPWQLAIGLMLGTLCAGIIVGLAAIGVVHLAF